MIKEETGRKIQGLQKCGQEVFIAQAPKDAGLNNNGSSAKTQAETAVLNPSPVINLCLF